MLLVRLALAQQPAIAPLEPVRAAVAVPKPAVVGVEVPRSPSVSIRLVCRPSSRPSPPALLLLNSRLVVGQQALAQLNPRAIAAIRVYKDTQELPGWPPFTDAVSGLIDMQLKKSLRVPSVPLSRLKRRLHLAGPVRYEQYGQLLPEAQLRIAKADISAVTVRVVAPGDTRIQLPAKTLLQLSASAVPASSQLPAGGAPRVFIRGLAH